MRCPRCSTPMHPTYGCSICEPNEMDARLPRSDESGGARARDSYSTSTGGTFSSDPRTISAPLPATSDAGPSIAVGEPAPSGFTPPGVPASQLHDYSPPGVPASQLPDYSPPLTTTSLEVPPLPAEPWPGALNPDVPPLVTPEPGPVPVTYFPSLQPPAASKRRAAVLTGAALLAALFF